MRVRSTELSSTARTCMSSPAAKDDMAADEAEDGEGLNK